MLPTHDSPRRRSPWLCARLAAGLLLACVFLSAATAEDEPAKKDWKNPGTGVGEGVGREGMWPAPTAKDWAKPVLLKFQRTWDDALAVAKETGKPILICINMDGEIASEHYAGIRYRQPAIAELYKPYVKVIASVYRHNPRDFDDQGNRILCPRFGSVTCGEHITIEPTIFEKFCDGRRIAPRHIAVDTEGKEAFDAYYVNDTAGVFQTIHDGRAKFPEAGPPIVRGDRPLLERVGSRHRDDRNAVETAYREGDAETRAKLLEQALASTDAAQLDLLRLAIFGLDPELAQKARAALAKIDKREAIDLINEAMQVPMADAERDALIATLKKIGGENALARWLAGVHQGLGAKSGVVNADAWARVKPGDMFPSVNPDKDGQGLTNSVEAQTAAIEERPEDPMPRLELAEGTLALAMEAKETYRTKPRLARQVMQHLLTDARTQAERALALGAVGWRAHSVIALSHYYQGDKDAAYAPSAKAMEGLPAEDSSWTSMAVLTVFAESRWMTIKRAIKAKQEWPSAYLADMHAAYSALRRHPMGTVDQALWHYEFLIWIGAESRASRVLTDAIGRWTDSLVLHEKLRARLLRRRGPVGLESTYKRLVDRHEKPGVLEPFAGYASFEAAESHRKRSRYYDAVAAYERCIAYYEAAVKANEGHKAGADGAISLAHAGMARVHYQLEDDEAALKHILLSYTRAPHAAGTRDGMGVNPGETGQMLLARLEKDGKTEAAASLKEALGGLDAALLAPDRGLRAPLPGEQPADGGR